MAVGSMIALGWMVVGAETLMREILTLEVKVSGEDREKGKSPSQNWTRACWDLRIAGRSDHALGFNVIAQGWNVDLVLTSSALNQAEVTQFTQGVRDGDTGAANERGQFLMR